MISVTVTVQDKYPNVCPLQRVEYQNRSIVGEVQTHYMCQVALTGIVKCDV